MSSWHARSSSADPAGSRLGPAVRAMAGWAGLPLANKVCIFEPIVRHLWNIRELPDETDRHQEVILLDQRGQQDHRPGTVRASLLGVGVRTAKAVEESRRKPHLYQPRHQADSPY